MLIGAIRRSQRACFSGRDGRRCPAFPALLTRREAAVAFGDRHRTEDRVYRFRIAYAWSQAPPSRTVRANRQCRGVHSERSELKSVVP